MSSKTRILVGMFIGVLISFIAFRGADIYNKFSPNGYQTFTIAVPNQFFKEKIVSPEDIKALARTFNEAMVFATARAAQMKDTANLKKLDALLEFFMRYDEERYQEWRKEHRKFF